MKRHFTVREIPQQNGVTERMNKTLLKNVWCILSNISMSKYLWTEALAYVYHLFNRLSSFAIGSKTLLEVWLGKVAQDYDSI